MKNPEIMIATFFIIESIIICYFFYVYSNNEKKNKIQRESELKELQNLILNKITETAKQLNEKFDVLGKDVKIFQEQANAKINLGFEKLQKENTNIQSDVNNKILDIKSSFKDYSQNVETTMSKYSEDNHNNKLEANKFKKEMQQDLKSILIEIKAPLDLD